MMPTMLATVGSLVGHAGSIEYLLDARCRDMESVKKRVNRMMEEEMAKGKQCMGQGKGAMAKGDMSSARLFATQVHRSNLRTSSLLATSDMIGTQLGEILQLRMHIATKEVLLGVTKLVDRYNRFNSADDVVKAGKILQTNGLKMEYEEDVINDVVDGLEETRAERANERGEGDAVDEILAEMDGSSTNPDVLLARAPKVLTASAPGGRRPPPPRPHPRLGVSKKEIANVRGGTDAPSLLLAGSPPPPSSLPRRGAVAVPSSISEKDEELIEQM